MSRIRTVKPELFKHEELFDAELDSGLPLRLAFIGLFTVADCEGRFKWRPRTLKLEVLPHDTVDFAQVLQALEQSGFIQSYSVDGERYGWIPNFKKHQRLQTKELAAGSELPAPCLQDQHGTNQERTQVRTGTHPEAQEGKGRERKGRGKEEEAAQAPFASPPPPASPPPSMPKPEPAAAPKAARQPKPIKAPIPADWMPAETTYALLEKHGIERPFAEGCLDEFRLYWTERGESRPGWEASFVNNVKRQWAHRTLSTTPTPRTSQRYAPPPRAMTPEAAHFEAILKNLNHPVIEGEIAHELH